MYSRDGHSKAWKYLFFKSDKEYYGFLNYLELLAIEHSFSCGPIAPSVLFALYPEQKQYYVRNIEKALKIVQDFNQLMESKDESGKA